MFIAVLLAAATLSQQLTAAAEDLLKIEKKIAASTEGSGALLYQDVLSLLDEAIDHDKTNLHAHARAAEVLLLMSDDGDGTFDVCTLLDARNEAEYVLKHGGEASDADLAHKVIRAIQEIPPDAIPDPPSACEQDEEHRHGSKTRSS
jgi:hypothetical protein